MYPASPTIFGESPIACRSFMKEHRIRVESLRENDKITNDYSYYEKILIKDTTGNLISEEIGSLTQFPDGKWRIS